MFDNKGFTIGDILHLSPKEAFELCQKGAIIVDVREEYLTGYKTFDVEQIIYCPLSLINEKYIKLPKDKPLIIADSVGLRSKESVLLLIQKGFTNIANMAGGLVEWERDELPLKSDITEKLTGSCVCQLKPRNRKQTNL
jgi:rhodanese-related sulfurtransferase